MTQTKHGRVIRRWPNGKIQTEETFNHGKLTGPFIVRNEVGLITYYCDYIQGQKQGHEIAYRPDGTVMAHLRWHQNRVVAR